ncbi:MAG TPA: hypothetical protein VNM92_03985 [Thermoanaerobaculia bacterium]|nr:hypothetical protein [Thermoanaerobaculia bacterium]
MPARSNGFQRMIKRIYDQLAPSGATVTESAPLAERGANKPREIDVLVEGTFADSPIRMAIECRDRSRTSDVEWIDALVGKYRDIDVQRIIAVSRKGFSAGAQDKARNNRIETRSLKEAMDTDWPAELMKLGLGRINVQYRIVSYTPETDPGWVSAAPPCFIEDPAGVRTSFGDFMTRITPAIGEIVSKKAFGRFKTVADLTATFMEDVTITPSVAQIISQEGSSHSLLRLTLHCNVDVTFDVSVVKRELFGDGVVGVSSGLIQLPDNQKTFRITVIQVPGKPITAPIVEEVNTRTKRAEVTTDPNKARKLRGGSSKRRT